MPSYAKAGAINQRSSEARLIYCTIIHFAYGGIYSHPIKEYERIFHRHSPLHNHKSDN